GRDEERASRGDEREEPGSFSPSMTFRLMRPRRASYFLNLCPHALRYVSSSAHIKYAGLEETRCLLTPTEDRQEGEINKIKESPHVFWNFKASAQNCAPQRPSHMLNLQQ
ncbi:hypothetical protein KUCAC02_017571, partial [Chaenocephalus aceratus]